LDFAEYKSSCVAKALQERNQYKSREDGSFICVKRNGDEYEIRFDKIEGYICECESYTYRHFCKHVAGLQLDPEYGHKLQKPVAQKMVVKVGSKIIGTAGED
jgi:hypothetical protein